MARRLALYDYLPISPVFKQDQNMCNYRKEQCTPGLPSEGVETPDFFCRCNNIMQQSNDLMPWSKVTIVEHSTSTRPLTTAKPKPKLQDSSVFLNYQFKHHEDISMFINDYRKTYTIPNMKSKLPSNQGRHGTVPFCKCYYSIKKSSQHLSCCETKAS